MAEEGLKFKSVLLLLLPLHQVWLKACSPQFPLSFPAQSACTALGVVKAALRWNNTAATDVQIRTLSLGQKSAPSFISVLKKSYPLHKVEKWEFPRDMEGLRYHLPVRTQGCPSLSGKSRCCGYPEGQGGAKPWESELSSNPCFVSTGWRNMGKPCEGSGLDSLISKDDGEGPPYHTWALWGLN